MTARVARAGMILAVVVAVVAADQSTKYLARLLLGPAGTVEGYGRFLVLTYAENEGAFLSLGRAWPAPVRIAVFSVMSSVVVVLAAVWAVRNGGLTPVRTVALSLLVGGGAGNLLDRFLRGGYVTDFAIVSVGPLHSGIFNLADLCLVAGVVLYAFASRRRKGPG